MGSSRMPELGELTPISVKGFLVAAGLFLEVLAVLLAGPVDRLPPILGVDLVAARVGHRIADLNAEFKSDPALFGRFSSDMASATPLGHVASASLATPATASRAAAPAPESTPEISVIRGN